MEPATLTAWAGVILELGVMTAELLDLGRRINAGEQVTAEDLAAAKAECQQAAADLDAAGAHDREDGT